MALELRQSLKLAQKLVMTPQLRQAIKLLQLNRLELTEALQAEIEQNPMLEEAPSRARTSRPIPRPSARKKRPTRPRPRSPTGSRATTPATVAEVNWEDYANNFDSDFSFSQETPPADAPSQFDFISATPGLASYLQWQLTHLELNEQDIELTHVHYRQPGRPRLSARPTLRISAPTATAPRKRPRAFCVWSRASIPPGVAARDIRESLLLQLDRLDYYDALPYRIVEQHMPLLESRNYAQMARETGAPLQKDQRGGGHHPGPDPLSRQRIQQRADQLCGAGCLCLQN